MDSMVAQRVLCKDCLLQDGVVARQYLKEKDVFDQTAKLWTGKQPRACDVLVTADKHFA